MGALISIAHGTNIPSTKVDIPECGNNFVICAGHGRTGSTSLQLALVYLGFNSYHSHDIPKNKQDHALWIKAADLKMAKLKENNINSFDNWNSSKCILNKEIPNEINWDNIFNPKNKPKYNALVGAPGFGFYLDLMHFYEKDEYNYDCKVILTQRQNADVWYKSILNSVGLVNSLLGSHWFLKRVLVPRLGLNVAKKTYFELIFNDSSYDSLLNEENCKKKYIEWNESVIHNVPKNQLLIFDVRDGWEPLCKFLNVKVPDIPFPRATETKSVQTVQKILKAITYVTDGCVIMIGIAFVYYIVSKRGSISKLKDMVYKKSHNSHSII